MSDREDSPLRSMPNGWEKDAPADGGKWKAMSSDGWNDEDWNARAGFDKPENISKHAFDKPSDAGNRGPSDGGCRNCGSDGHFARDCPEPKTMTGECYNCGEVGHNKADCPNPKVARPFTGTCNLCGVEGHPAALCPDKGPIICKNCKKEGHKTAECTEPRALDWTDVDDMDAGAAWELLKKASDEKDIDDFKKAVKIYVKAVPDTTYYDLELKYREENFKIYTIALEKEMPVGSTSVNLQGKADCKYIVSYQFQPKPKRAKFAEGWPETPEENLERLKDAGNYMETVLPVCRRCNQLGHISKSCKEEEVERDVLEIECSNCNEKGHRLRDCPKEIIDKNVCRNCKEPGHKASECEQPRSAEGVECKRCNEMGHFAKDCPNNQGGGGGRGCRNCGEEGHFAKDCDKPKNPDNVMCRNCDEMGHFSRDCPKPRDWSKVKCNNCGQMGHTIKRCTQAGYESNGGPGAYESNGGPGAHESNGGPGAHESNGGPGAHESNGGPGASFGDDKDEGGWGGRDGGARVAW